MWRKSNENTRKKTCYLKHFAEKCETILIDDPPQSGNRVANSTLTTVLLLVFFLNTDRSISVSISIESKQQLKKKAKKKRTSRERANVSG